MAPVALAAVEFAPVELRMAEELAAKTFMPANIPSSVVPATKYRE
jgi:hypothetical protein